MAGLPDFAQAACKALRGDRARISWRNGHEKYLYERKQRRASRCSWSPLAIMQELSEGCADADAGTSAATASRQRQRRGHAPIQGIKRKHRAITRLFQRFQVMLASLQRRLGPDDITCVVAYMVKPHEGDRTIWTYSSANLKARFPHLHHLGMRKPRSLEYSCVYVARVIKLYSTAPPCAE